MTDATTPARHPRGTTDDPAVSRIVLPEPRQRPTFDEWLAGLDAAHQECICDTTKFDRHCKVCTFDAPWPCHVRVLVDGFERAVPRRTSEQETNGAS